MERGEIIIISVGGSLIVPDEIDVAWIRDFKRMIDSFIKQGKRFIIICGGGRTARKYQEAGRDLGIDSEEQDWLGIQATVINAQLIKSLFEDVHEKIISVPHEKVNFKHKLLIAGGWKPGFSTDYDAVIFAKTFGVKKIINLSNIDYVYDKDPKKFSDAKKIEETSWKDFRKIVGDKWIPGLNAPFDPIASKEAEKIKLEVAIMNGKNIDNVKKCIEGSNFEGTLIK